MAYCPNGHGPKSGVFCDECGLPLTSAPGGDSVRIRSPEAHATVNPTFILPGGQGAAPAPGLIKCPRCGKRNAESSTFDCQGGCERTHLCERHFDEEYEVCVDCAAQRRKVAAQAAAERQALEADRAGWRSKAERLEKELAAAQAACRRAETAHAAAQAELQQKSAQFTAVEQAQTARIAALEQEAQSHRSRAADLTRQLADVRRDLAETSDARTAAERALAAATQTHAAAQQQLQTNHAGMEKRAAGWQQRAEQAEAQLAEIRRKEEAAARAAEEHHKAEAAAKDRPIADRYSVVHTMGRGSFGVVYLAQDTRLRDRAVALKVLHPHLSVDKTALPLFKREAIALASLRHDHIVTYYDYGFWRDQIFLVMQYIEGASLAQVVKERGALPADTVTAWLLQTADALAHAHSRGVIHCDIKAANLLLESASNRIYVSDFGLARAAQHSGGSDRTCIREELDGTAAYRAPEVYNTGHTVASDLYNLGVVAYELLAGQRPFPGSDPLDLMMAHATAPAPPLPASVPASLGAVVLRLLSKRPEQRYADGAAVMAALARVRERGSKRAGETG